MASIGSGGHAAVLQKVLLELGTELAGFIAEKGTDSSLENVAWLGPDETFLSNQREKYILVNGVGSVGSTLKRKELFEAFSIAGFRFMSVISKSAIVANSVKSAEGVQVLAGAIVVSDATLCENSLINTGAIVEHGCIIGKHAHVASGAVLCGNVRIGEGTHVGANATIRQGVVVGSNCVIGAGSVVIHDVPDNSVVFGVPARLRDGVIL